MPRYQLGKVMFPEYLLEPVWKKPSANLPLLEISLSPAMSASPVIRVLLYAAAQAGELYPRENRSQNSV
jgi:hypothetical protein